MMRSILSAGPLALGLIAAALTPLAPAQNITFNDVTANSALDVFLANGSPGLAVGDIDGDDYLDVMICGAGNPKPQIFHNRGAAIAAGGSGPLFVDVTAALFPLGASEASAGLFADVDNDGDPDIVLARRYFDPQLGLISAKYTGLEIYANRNSGQGFYKITGNDLGKDFTPFGGLTLGDGDLDGKIDLVYVHNGGGNGVGGPGAFLHNSGGFQFQDHTQAFNAALGNVTRYFSTIMFDFSGDGRQDLHCAVDFYTDRHFQGLPGGGMTEVTTTVGTTNTGSDMGLAIGDPDMDGDFDLYSTNINVGVFYENDGAGNFQNTASAHGISSFNHGLNTCTGWGTAFSDFDLDGDEDLITIGSLSKAELFENNGSGQFSRVSQGAGIVLIGRTLVPFDYDRDGDLDVLMSYGGVNQTPRLYENVTPSTQGRHYLTVEAIGTLSNRDSIGAKVEITVRGVKLVRAIVAGHSFKSGLPYTAHFGLNTSGIVQEVKVIWPSGKVATMTNVPVDTHVRMVEPLI
jgi:hypothetical protein